MMLSAAFSSCRSALFRGMGILLLLVVLWSGAAQAGSFSRVIIDAGHGGHDNGGQFGYLYEKHLALDVTFRLQRYLEGKGIKCTLTRQRDVFIPLGAQKTPQLPLWIVNTTINQNMAIMPITAKPRIASKLMYLCSNVCIPPPLFMY
jgi:hypothetical protein